MSEIPSLRAGRDTCARCGMIVSDARFAAGYVDAGGRSVLFDDAGEALDVVAASPDLAGRLWVQDTAGGGWQRGTAARFLSLPGYATPMGSGLVAFATGPGAEAFARSVRRAGARVMTLAEAVAARSRPAPRAGR